MLPDTVIRLADVPNIVGVKEATGDLARVQAIRSGTGNGFALYSGDDATSRDFLLLGGDGVISVTANVVPGAMHRMCEAALSGDATKAAEIDGALAGLHKALFVESNPIPVKWALAAMGMIPQGIRLPLTWLSRDAEAPVRDAMKQAGLNV